MTDEPKYPFADQFKQDKAPSKHTSSVPREPKKVKIKKPEPAPLNPSLQPLHADFSKAGRHKRTAVIDQDKKDYMQVIGAAMLPIEDFYPGCICSPAQILPDEVDIELLVTCARTGMLNRQIAPLFDMTVETLEFHFRKTLAKVRANRTLDVLDIVNGKADEGDMNAITMVLKRLDPEPFNTPTVVVMQPLPAHIIDMPAVDLTAQLKQLKNNKGD